MKNSDANIYASTRNMLQRPLKELMILRRLIDKRNQSFVPRSMEFSRNKNRLIYFILPGGKKLSRIYPVNFLTERANDSFSNDDQLLSLRM